jgi:hypothetical protein
MINPSERKASTHRDGREKNTGKNGALSAGVSAASERAIL